MRRLLICALLFAAPAWAQESPKSPPFAFTVPAPPVVVPRPIVQSVDAAGKQITWGFESPAIGAAEAFTYTYRAYVVNVATGQPVLPSPGAIAPFTCGATPATCTGTLPVLPPGSYTVELASFKAAPSPSPIGGDVAITNIARDSEVSAGTTLTVDANLVPLPNMVVSSFQARLEGANGLTDQTKQATAHQRVADASRQAGPPSPTQPWRAELTLGPCTPAGVASVIVTALLCPDGATLPSGACAIVESSVPVVIVGTRPNSECGR